MMRLYCGCSLRSDHVNGGVTIQEMLGCVSNIFQNSLAWGFLDDVKYCLVWLIWLINQGL